MISHLHNCCNKREDRPEKPGVEVWLGCATQNRAEIIDKTYETQYSACDSEKEIHTELFYETATCEDIADKAKVHAADDDRVEEINHGFFLYE